MSQENGKKKMVLVVDDDPILRNSLKRYIDSLGYDAKAVTDGFDVLLLLEYLKPDLIISDIRMPKLDGLTLLQALGNKAETREIPVIFMSALQDDQILDQARKLGATFFVLKPFPLNYLGDLIRRFMPGSEAAAG
jgi:CheY-like chemotaxis protein